MKRVLRIDSGSLRRPERTPQGFLRADGWVGRAGIYEYTNTEQDEKDGFGKRGATRRELRSDAVVSAATALAGFEAAPITLGHPKGKITAENVRQHEVGSVAGAARMDGDRVAATLVIKDAKAIKAVESGKQELSPGYLIDYEPKSGVDSKYGRYDGVQHNIVINHLALVDRARGGSDLRLRMDGIEERADSNGKLTSVVDGHQHLIDLDPQWGSKMSGCTSWTVAEGAEHPHEHPWVRNADGSISIGEADGHTHTILDGASIVAARGDAQFDRPHAITEGRNSMSTINNEELIRSLRAQLDEATSKLKEHEGAATTHSVRADAAEQRVAVLSDEVSTLKAQIAAAATVVETEAIKREALRADAAEAKVREFDTTFDKAVKARVALERRASVVLGPEFRMDGLSPTEIRTAGIKRLDAKVDTRSLNETQLEARFDALYDLHAQNARSQQRIGDLITAQNEQRADGLEEKRQKWRNQGNEPLPSSREARKGA